jgi:hypothetical protein
MRGGTLTGPLLLAADPGSPAGSRDGKQYVDAGSGGGATGAVRYDIAQSLTLHSERRPAPTSTR